MGKNFFARIPRKIQISAIAVIVLLLAFFVLRFLPIRAVSVPSDFLQARQEASKIAEEIVSMSQEGTLSLGQIASYDDKKKYSEALLLISQEIERNRAIREKAISLSAKLEAMTKNISSISPASAGQIALEAISSETSLISRLINYNDYLMQLLENLRDKFMGVGNGDKLPEIIEKINSESRAINDLNQKFNDLMKKFDGAL